MDVLPRITRQLIELFRAMSRGQRVTSIAVTFALSLAFGWLVFVNQRADFQAISFGKVFSADELESAEKALIAGGLTGFRKDGQRILAPAKELNRYNATLLEHDALPADMGSQLLKQFETLGPFSTDRHRQQMKEALLLQELRRMIKDVPDIEDARVAIATSERRVAWNQKPRVTANVTIKPRGGRDISATLINSLRQAVASMVPDLKPADVTIFDVTRGQAYTGEPKDDPIDSRYLQRAREFTRQYESQIQKALSHIPHVSVTVHVDLDALKSEIEHVETARSRNEQVQIANRSAAVDEFSPHLTGFRGPSDEPKEPTAETSDNPLIAAMPKAVQVSVSVPREYLRELVNSRTAKGEKSRERLDPNLIEDEVLAKVERIVSRLIPADSAHDAISVTCVDHIDNDSRDESLTSIQTIVDQKWVVLVGVVLVALSTLWMLRRDVSVPVVPIVTEFTDVLEIEPQSFTSEPGPAAVIPSSIVVPDRTAILRDEIRSMVETDPAGSAAILIKWLSEAQA